MPTQSIKVSSYLIGVAPPGFLGTNTGPVVAQLDNNFANSRIFQQGKTPFVGDYIAVAGQAAGRSIRSPGHGCRTQRPSTSKPTFFVAWGDNRMLRGNTIADLVAADRLYAPDVGGAADGVSDPTMTYPACSPATPLSNTRNQEIFGTTIKPGLIVTVPSASETDR